VAKTLADIEKTIGILDETGEAHKGGAWKFWVIIPLVLATVAGCAFLVVRRIFGSSEG
jgi:hypothetical protein